MRVRWASSAAVVLLVLGSACSAGGAPKANRATGPAASTSETSQGPSAVATISLGFDHQSVVWLDNTTLFSAELGDLDNTFYIISIVDKKPKRVHLPNEASVGSSPQRFGWHYGTAVQRVSDWTIAIGRTDWPGRGIDNGFEIALDLKSGDVRTLAPIPSALYGNNRPDGVFWNQRLTSGYATEVDASLHHCATIVRITGSGVGPWPMEVGDNGRHWNLSDGLTQRETCSKNSGEAHAVTVSAARDEVMFFATDGPVDHALSSSHEAPRGNVYKTSPSRHNASPVLKNVTIVALSVSPDGRQLLWTGHDDQGAHGSWLLDLATNHSTRFSTTIFTSAAWSPDGRHLAADDLVSGTVTLFDLNS